jgi:ATP-dependent RNA helicase SUPV3L1/SUV3
MHSDSGQGRITAVLGPTNTGKTYFALERMLGHASGMIGFPLRLLARENYDRIVKAKGAGQVALITGEEKIIPPHPKWFVCTVESMPLDRRVAFLAVDEIQLCADPERGHIFTDRLLHARGEQETVFLGAETIKPLIRRLVPGVEFITRPRFSSLTHTGPRKLNRLAPRSVVVAFSASEVYAMAEFVRRARGGAAVVLGALSPRTRNAQVGMYQAGEVDYIVATDAIGMGLNMDVDHVAFASLRKFDGRAPRPLEAPEIAQIAGRAGRHMNDGTFGTTGDCGAIAPELAEAVEGHRFPPLKALIWRNSQLRFASVAALLGSLDKRPSDPGLIRAREADDQTALLALAQDAEIMTQAQGSQRVKLLWEVCQIPDFRKVMDESHTRLLGRIFTHLVSPAGRLPTDWLAENVGRIDRTDGELDTIVARIAHIRTWTYVTHRPDWVLDPGHWQGVTRAIEDRLSDALHDRLTNRFVDKRTSVLAKRLRDGAELAAAHGEDGTVLVEGQRVGTLKGFSFTPDGTSTAGEARLVMAAAMKAIRPEIEERLKAALADGPDAYGLAPDGVVWRGAVVGRLAQGPEALRPLVELAPDDVLEPAARRQLAAHLDRMVQSLIARDLAPLAKARAASLKGAARGLVHQLAENLGSLPIRQAEREVAALSPADRAALARLSIRFGTESLFIPDLAKPAAQALRAVLWAAQRGCAVPPIPGKKPAITIDAALPADFYGAVGFAVAGGVAVRADILERFAFEYRTRLRAGETEPGRLLLSLLGLGKEATLMVMAALDNRPRRSRHARDNPDSPFAVLRKGL